MAAITLTVDILHGLFYNDLGNDNSGVLKIQGTSFPSQQAPQQPKERNA